MTITVVLRSVHLWDHLFIINVQPYISPPNWFTYHLKQPTKKCRPINKFYFVNTLLFLHSKQNINLTPNYWIHSLLIDYNHNTRRHGVYNAEGAACAQHDQARRDAHWAVIFRPGLVPLVRGSFPNRYK